MNEVIIASYPQAPAAHLARMQLESHGIEAWLDNENFSTMYPFLPGPAGGVQLKVWEDDAPAAAEFIHGLDEDARMAQETAARTCPQCHSVRSRENTLGLFALAAMVIVTCGFYLPLCYWKHECQDCGHRW